MEFKDKTEKKTYENWKISLLQTFKEAYPEAIITFPGEKKEAPLPEPPKPQEKVMEDIQRIVEEKAKKAAEEAAKIEEERKAKEKEEILKQIEKLKSKLK
jgi:septin family protein